MNKQGIITEIALDRIFVSTSVTRNLGDYNSIKVTAGLNTDIGPDEETSDAFKRAWEIVDTEIEVKITEAIEALEAA